MSNDIPRRNRLDLCTYEENKIREAIANVEGLGAHPLLTDCVVLLLKAKEKLSDFIDQA